MVVAAHPDDEVLGGGTTLAQYIEDGCDVKVIIMANGITARYTTMAPEAEAQLEQLIKDSVDALAELGVKPEQILHMKLPDMKMFTRET